MGRDISQLHPELQLRVTSLQQICAKQGLLIGIADCFRTVEEQNALYAQGRTTAGSIVTNANGNTYTSMHQWGVAFDFIRNDGLGAYNEANNFFEKVGQLGKSISLEWGGDWTSFVDRTHFQLPDWGSTPKLLKQLYEVPENFIKTWGTLIR